MARLKCNLVGRNSSDWDENTVELNVKKEGNLYTIRVQPDQVTRNKLDKIIELLKKIKDKL